MDIFTFGIGKTPGLVPSNAFLRRN